MTVSIVEQKSELQNGNFQVLSNEKKKTSVSLVYRITGKTHVPLRLQQSDFSSSPFANRKEESAATSSSSDGELQSGRWAGENQEKEITQRYA